MKNYLVHLKQLSSPETFRRKQEYLDYNLGRYLNKLNLQESRLLEIGPGLGEFIYFLNNRGTNNIDIADNNKDICNYISKNFKVKEFFVTDDISKLDKKLSQYNLIFLMQVLEHMPINQYGLTLKTLYNHLVPSGFLVIIIPNANNPLGLTERYADLQHTNSFTEQSLKDLVNLSEIDNFEMEIKGYEIPPSNFLNIIRLIFQKILHTILLLTIIINGGTFFKTMTPNIMLVIKKK